MIERLIVLLWTLPLIHRVLAQGECTDVRGRLISHGLHYVPGPDTCTLCVCDNGQPKVCKAVLCSPPQDCRSFRVGNTCCEFICLDDVVKPVDANEHSFRMAAGGLVGVIILTLILIIYRMKWQKRARPPHVDDQRSLTSIGYISGSMGYVGGTCETGLSGWKPPSNYLPRGEAPPPYDEAIAQSRAEVLRYNNEANLHRTYPANLEPLVRPEDPMHCAAHNYINYPRSLQQVPNPNNCFTAPLLQPMHNMDMRDTNPIMPHPLHHNVQVGFPSAIRLTGSLGAITNRGLLSLLQRDPPDHERPHNVPGFYANNGAMAMHNSLHRTIPRISTAIETVLDTPITGFNRTDRSIPNEVRRSFHKPNERTHGLTETGRSMPRNLNLASNSELTRIETNLCPNQTENYSNNVLCTPGRVRNVSQNDTSDVKSLNKVVPKPVVQKPVVQPENVAVGPSTATLPLTVDKPSCVCSYTDAAQGEADDYRSECENCKTTSGSRWVVEEGWISESEEGTQTLQRRAPPAPAPATATLPQPVSRPRATMGPPSNWDNWFSTIPDSDTESEEE